MAYSRATYVFVFVIVCTFALRLYSQQQTAVATSTAPATSLQCGNINPHMVATAYSDIDPNQGFPPKTFRNDNWTPVPVGQANSIARDGSEYTNNGGGSISMSMNSSCVVLAGTENTATEILSFDTQTTAVTGKCCPGWGPGGDGATTPEWTGQIDLPGDHDDEWDLSIVLSSVEIGPSSKCNIQVDGKDKPESANTQVAEHYSLRTGGHLVGVSCSEGRIGARPGPWNFTAQFSEQMRIVIQAVRTKAESARFRLIR